jgi:hypothetical protein
LPADIGERRKAFEILRGVLESSGALEDAAAERLERVAELFNIRTEEVDSNPTPGAANKSARVRSVS